MTKKTDEGKILSTDTGTVIKYTLFRPFEDGVQRVNLEVDANSEATKAMLESLGDDAKLLVGKQSTSAIQDLGNGKLIIKAKTKFAKGDRFLVADSTGAKVDLPDVRLFAGDTLTAKLKIKPTITKNKQGMTYAVNYLLGIQVVEHDTSKRKAPEGSGDVSGISALAFEAVDEINNDKLAKLKG